MEQKVSITEINRTADLVFVGTVVDISSRFNEQQTMIFTDVVFDDVELVHARGSARGAQPAPVRLTYAGGQVGVRGVTVSGAPRFEQDQRYLVFMLDPGKTYANPIVGGSQGQFRVIIDTASAREYLLTSSGKAVIGVENGDVLASREAVDRIEDRRIVAKTSSRSASDGKLEDPPLSADSKGSASQGPPHHEKSLPEVPMPLEDFIKRLREMRKAEDPGGGLLRFGDHPGSFYTEENGQIVESPLPSRPAEHLLRRAVEALRFQDDKSLAPDDGAPRMNSAGNGKILGGTLGYCGYQDLKLTMEQVPESWWSWHVNNTAMYDWNQVMDVYRYVDDDGSFGDNSEDEFCGWVSDSTLHSVYGFHWDSGIAMCITWTFWCECCEITQSDIMWNSAYSWTDNWSYAIGNSSVVYLAPVAMHELGHSWGMQRGSYTETYDYDQPTVMHSYYHNVIENGRGVHRSEAWCVRDDYDDQTSILSTKDIGVESYWASNGLHNSYLSSSTVHPGNSITVNGVTVENISRSAVSDLRIRFFLSSNRTITTGDHQMGSYWYWSSFSGEAYNVGNYTTTVPTVAAGEYYVGAMVTMNGFGSDDFTANNTSSLYEKVTVLPATPTGVSASDGTYDDRIRVSWSAVAGATSYDVRRCTDSSCASYLIVGTTTSTYYDYTIAPPKCTRYFRVVAKSPWGNSYSSGTASGWMAFEVPTWFFASDNQPERVRMTWDPVPGADSYILWRGTCTPLHCIYVSIGSSTGTLFDDTTATPGRQYDYYVVPQNSCGSGSASAVNAGSIALPAPTGVAASDGTYVNRIHVTWNAVANAASYDVWRGVSEASITKIGSAPGTSFDDTTASEGTTYYYFIAARSPVGAGALSDSNTGYLKVSLIFTDGFESGDCTGWSWEVP